MSNYASHSRKNSRRYNVDTSTVRTPIPDIHIINATIGADVRSQVRLSQRSARARDAATSPIRHRVSTRDRALSPIDVFEYASSQVSEDSSFNDYVRAYVLARYNVFADYARSNGRCAVR